MNPNISRDKPEKLPPPGAYQFPLVQRPHSSSSSLLISPTYLSPNTLQNVSNGFHHQTGIPITKPQQQQQQEDYNNYQLANCPTLQQNLYTTPMVHQFSQDPDTTYRLINSSTLPTPNYGYTEEVYQDSNNFQHPVDMVDVDLAASMSIVANNSNIYNCRKYFESELAGPSDDMASSANEGEKMTFYTDDNEALNLSKQVPPPSQQQMISPSFQTTVHSSNSTHFDDNLLLQQQPSVIMHTGDVSHKSGAENSQTMAHHNFNPAVGNKVFEGCSPHQIMHSSSNKKGSRVVTVGGRIIVNKNENTLNMAMGQNHQQQFECIMNEIQSNQSGECAMNYANIDSNGHWNGASENQTSLGQNCHPFPGASSPRQGFSPAVDLHARYLETASPAMYSNNASNSGSMEDSYIAGENLQAVTPDPQQFSSFPPPRGRKPRGSNPSRARNNTTGRGRGRKQASMHAALQPTALANGIENIGGEIQNPSLFRDSYVAYENTNFSSIPTPLPKSGRGRGRKKQTAVASQIVIPSPSFGNSAGEVVFYTPENPIASGKKSTGSRKKSKDSIEMNSSNNTETITKEKSVKRKQGRKSAVGSDSVQLGIDPKISTRVMSDDDKHRMSPDITAFNCGEGPTTPTTSGRGRGRGGGRGRGRGRGRGGKAVGNDSPGKPGRKRAIKQQLPVNNFCGPREPIESFQDIFAKTLNMSGTMNEQPVSTTESSSGDGQYSLPINNHSAVDLRGMELLSQCVADCESKQLTSSFDSMQMTDQPGLSNTPLFHQPFDIQNDDGTTGHIEDLKPAIVEDSSGSCDEMSTCFLAPNNGSSISLNIVVPDFSSPRNEEGYENAASCSMEVPAAPHDNGNNVDHVMEDCDVKITADEFTGTEEFQGSKGKKRRSMKTTTDSTIAEKIGKTADNAKRTTRKSRNTGASTAKRQSTKKGGDGEIESTLNVESAACAEEERTIPAIKLTDVKTEPGVLMLSAQSAENDSVDQFRSELVTVKSEGNEERQMTEIDNKAENTEEKKSEGSIAHAKVNKRNVLKRPVNRSLKKPKIPMRESFSSNLVRGVGSRGKGKKTLKLESEEDETNEGPINRITEVKTMTSKYIMPLYTEQEKEILYGNERFVIDVNDVDKEPDNIYIWQILDRERCLRQYFPAKYGLKQFFVSSPVKWYFCEEEFKNEFFYARFQPIVVVIANCHSKGKPLEGKRIAMTDSVVQFVHIDKPFFCRMCKYIGKIQKTEDLRKEFMVCFPVYTFLTLYPTFLKDNLNCSKTELGPHENMLQAWKSTGVLLEHIISLIEKRKCFTEDTFERLWKYPSLNYSSTGVNKDVDCSACYAKARVPNVKVSFSPKENMEKPYDHETLEEYVEDADNRHEKQVFYWCRACSTSAKKLHRLIHFRYNLLRITRQNIVKDIETFKRLDTPITDEILLWTQSQAISWKNVMFLDFQMCVAEWEDEIFV